MWFIQQQGWKMQRGINRRNFIRKACHFLPKVKAKRLHLQVGWTSFSYKLCLLYFNFKPLCMISVDICLCTNTFLFHVHACVCTLCWHLDYMDWCECMMRVLAPQNIPVQLYWHWVVKLYCIVVYIVLYSALHSMQQSICIHMQAYVHACIIIDQRKHTCVHTKHAHAHTMSGSVRAHTHTHTHNADTHIQAHTHAMLAHIHTLQRLHAHTHTHTHRVACTHAHMHALLTNK